MGSFGSSVCVVMTPSSDTLTPPPGGMGPDRHLSVVGVELGEQLAGVEVPHPDR